MVCSPERASWVFQMVLDWVVERGLVCVSLEYRLPPEHQDPAPLEDCYAGLTWMATHAAELGIDPANIIIAGVSAGGGLAAGTALMARDRGVPSVRAQVLDCPMVDKHNDSVSACQYPLEGTWSQGSNDFLWNCYTGDERRRRNDISHYDSPSRAKDLSHLPPAYMCWLMRSHWR